MRSSPLLGKLLATALLLGFLASSCETGDDSKDKDIQYGSDSSGSSSSLSGSVVSELESNLSSNSSSRQTAGRSLSERSAALSTITLTTAQISAVAAAATTAVQNAGMTDSADLIELLPKIIEGAQGSLSDMGLSSSETIKVIQVIVFSMTQSLSGRDAYLPSPRANPDADQGCQGLRVQREQVGGRLHHAACDRCRGEPEHHRGGRVGGAQFAHVHVRERSEEARAQSQQRVGLDLAQLGRDDQDDPCESGDDEEGYAR